MSTTDPRASQDLALARAATRLLDDAFTVPGTRLRMGLDPLLGLIPGLGDALGALLSSYLIWLAAQRGAPRAVILRMVLNAGIDATLGAIPLAGDFFDVVWKANRRNLALLEAHLAEPRPTRRRSLLLLAAIALGLLAIVGAVFVLLIWAVREIAQAMA